MTEVVRLLHFHSPTGRRPNIIFLFCHLLFLFHRVRAIHLGRVRLVYLGALQGLVGVAHIALPVLELVLNHRYALVGLLSLAACNHGVILDSLLHFI